MKKEVYGILNNVFNIFPGYGRFLAWRGKLFKYFFKNCGKNLKISSNVNIYNPKNVFFGDNVYVGYNTYMGGGIIKLSNEVIIGPFCSIVAGNHTIKDGSFRFGPYDYGKIEIGEGTWLGSHAVICSNVKIGRGCLIAAGAVVTKDVEDYSLVAGVPGKIIRKFNGE